LFKVVMRGRREKPLQHLANRALIDAASSDYAMEGRAGARKHRSLQLLQLLRRQSQRTTAAFGIAQPSDAVVIAAATPSRSV